MIDLVMSKILNGQFMFSLAVAVAAAATVFTLALPILDRDVLKQRLRSVGVERERIRAREREKLASQQKVSIRYEQKVAVKNFVENFNLSQWFGTDTSKEKLLQAGFRSSSAEMMFVVFRLICPVVFFSLGLFYVFVILTGDYSTLTRFGMALGGAFLGLKAPEIYLNNIIQKRQL
jgi:tight adherence protein C